MDNFFLIISTGIFLLGFVLAMQSLRKGRQGEVRLNLWLAIIGLIFQSLFLKIRGEMHGRCPITNGAEVLVFISWSIVILYLALGRPFRLSLLGVFSMPLIFLFQLAAIVWLALADPGPRPTDQLDPWLELHAAMSLLAYGAFGLTGIAGIMYLLQDRQLKSRAPGRLFYSLPPIRFLVDAIARLLAIGVALLTIGIVAAFFMEVRPDLLHLGASGAVWVIYIALLVVCFGRKVAPKRLALFSIVVFGFALLTLSVL